ncbi:hypothetical protein [Tenacibaculum sp. 190524A05c]|uniref:hypothetical protein n=1 Tax=Tenacibaculum platacis TaxID=3137852 RepID=UPI0032B13A63
MIKRLNLFLLVIILSSCSNSVSKKDLQGTWWNTAETGDFEIIFKGDSIAINNGFGITLYGTFNLEKDSISITVNNKTHKEYLKYKPGDSLLIFNNSRYFKSPLSAIEVDKTFHFIDIKSKKTIHFDTIKNSTNFIKLSKSNLKTTQLILNDKKADISMIPGFLLSCKIPNKYKKPFILLGKGITLKELTRLYSNFDSVNFPLISVLSKYEFKSRKLHYYDIRIELFKEQLLKNAPPPRELNVTRTDYIKKFKPENVVIKSKEDFAKLDTLKTDLNYLISIDLDLPIEEYLHLNQKINTLRKKEKFNIRTELILL